MKGLGNLKYMKNFIVKATLWSFNGYFLALEFFSVSQHRCYHKIPLGVNIRERKIGLNKLIPIMLFQTTCIFMFFVS